MSVFLALPTLKTMFSNWFKPLLVRATDLAADDKECCLCKENFGEGDPPCLPVRTTGCNHVFGHQCLMKWEKTSDSGSRCPLCRQSLDIGAPEEKSKFIRMMEKIASSCVYGLLEAQHWGGIVWLRRRYPELRPLMKRICQARSDAIKHKLTFVGALTVGIPVAIDQILVLPLYNSLLAATTSSVTVYAVGFAFMATGRPFPNFLWFSVYKHYMFWVGYIQGMGVFQTCVTFVLLGISLWKSHRNRRSPY